MRFGHIQAYRTVRRSRPSQLQIFRRLSSRLNAVTWQAKHRSMKRGWGSHNLTGGIERWHRMEYATWRGRDRCGVPISNTSPSALGCVWFTNVCGLAAVKRKLGSDLEASPDASGGPAMDKGHTNRPTRCVPISRQCQYRTRRDRDRQRPF